MDVSGTLFGGLSAEDFLREYWQRKPLLVQGAFPDFVSPCSPDDLATLACMKEAPARIILEQGGEIPWEVRFGPFDLEDFAGLPKKYWTLLVQQTDRHIPAVAELLDVFRFLPNWRMDDVLISYAPEHGGAGAHIDSYDVFLVQAHGHRRWEISTTPAPSDVAFAPDVDIELLEDFDPDCDWVLAPGDLLYLPPRIPHRGTALDECMTMSVGFRAPSHQEILTGFLERAADFVPRHAYYTDPGLAPSANPGRIRPAALARVRAVIQQALQEPDVIDRWFASYVTEPAPEVDLPWPETPCTADGICTALQKGAWLFRTAVVYFAYLPDPEGARLYTCGQEYILDHALAFAAPLLSGRQRLTHAALEPHLAIPSFCTLLADLVNEGCLQIMEEGGLET